MTCEQLKGTAEANKNEGMDGEVSLLFEKCKAKIGTVEAQCTSLTAGVPASDIHVLGATFDRRYLLPSPTSGVNMAILLTESSEHHVHYSCSIILILLAGCLASDNSKINELVSSVPVSFLQKEDKQTVTSIDNLPATAMETCELLVMKGSEANEKIIWLAEATITATTGTVLVMA